MTSSGQISSPSTSVLLSEASALLRAETKSQRDREAQRLTTNYSTCKSQLDQLVSQNVQTLASAQNMYHTVAANLALAKKKLKTIKETLKACRTRLSVGSAIDVGQLFTESCELKYALALLEQADAFHRAYNTYETSMFNHDYLAAAESLLLACSISENNPLFDDAPALTEIKNGLDKEKRRLMSCILQGIREAIFMCKFPSRKISMASIHPDDTQNAQVKVDLPQPLRDEYDEHEKYEKKLRRLVKCYALHGDVNDCYAEILDCLEADVLGLIEQIRRDDECCLRTDPDMTDHIDIVKMKLRHFADIVRIFDVESSEIASGKFIASADLEISKVLAKYAIDSNDTSLFADFPCQEIPNFFQKRTITTIKASLFKFNRSSAFVNRSASA